MPTFFNLNPHRKLQIIIVIFLMSWLVGTFFIHWFEAAQSWSYFDAFYYTVMITATIGAGHLEALSMAGKILTMAYAIFYVPLFLYSMTLIFEGRLKHIHKEEKLFDKTLHDVEEDVERIIYDSSKHTFKKEK